MLILKILLIIVEVVCSFLLIVVILLQKAKGEGLGLAFGAQMGESLFGARASNVLVRITVWLGIIFMVCTAFLARIYSQGYGRSLMERKAPIEQGAMPIRPGAPVPASLPAARPVMPDAQPPPFSAPAESSLPASAAPAAMPQPQE